MAKRATKAAPEPTTSVDVGGPARNDNAAVAAPTTIGKKDKAPPAPRVALSCRMSPELAKAIVGKFRVTIPIPKDETLRDVTVGARLFLREWWDGVPTGRADLVRVVAVSEDDGTEGYADRCTVERGWCWLREKLDDDLTQLALTVLPDHFPGIGY